MNRTCLELVAADVRGANTDATLAQTRFVIQWIYMPIVVLFGVVANILNIVVLTRKDMFSSTNYYLAVLACCDILFLAGGMLYTMPKLLPQLILFHPFMFLTSYFQVMTTYVSNLSVAIICCFTVERFIVIRWPMKGRVWFTRERAKRIVLAAIMFTFVTEIPNLVFYWPVLQEPNAVRASRAAAARLDSTCAAYQVSGNATDVNATVCAGRNASSASQIPHCSYWKKMHTPLAAQAEVLILVTSWTTAVLYAFLPLMLLSVLNGYLIRSVLVAHSERCLMTNATASLIVPTQHCLLLDPTCKTSISTHQAKAKRENHNERKVTIMLIAVVLLFLACHLPNAFGLLYTTALEREYLGRIPIVLNNRRLIMNNIFNALTQLNAAANFILYSLLSKKFNHTMRQLLASTMTALCRRKARRSNRFKSDSSLNINVNCSERQSFHTKLASIMSPELSSIPFKNGTSNCVLTTSHSVDQMPLRRFESRSQPQTVRSAIPKSNTIVI